jgi:hypothetical protein
VVKESPGAADAAAPPGRDAEAGPAQELPATASPPPDEDGDHAYFQAIEDHFVGLRGAPLLLSPVDWQVARRWHRQEIPLAVVRRALDDLFARRRERGARGRVSSLRYCVPAVEAAWADHADLAAPGARGKAEPFDTAGRLAALADALTNLPLRPPASGDAGDRGEPIGAAALAGLRARLLALAQSDLDAQVVEERLADLDRETLDTTLASLSTEDRASLDAAVAKTMAALASRLPEAELERARERLTRQVLRGRLGLPTLSLFSPEALGPAPGQQ